MNLSICLEEIFKANITQVPQISDDEIHWKLPVSIAAGGIAGILLIVVLVVVVRN